MVKTFWNILSDYQRKIGVIGWYPSFPAQKTNGFIISDKFFYQIRYKDNGGNKLLTYPPKLYSDLKDLSIDRTPVSNKQLISELKINRTTWQKMRRLKYYSKMLELLKSVQLTSSPDFSQDTFCNTVSTYVFCVPLIRAPQRTVRYAYVALTSRALYPQASTALQKASCEKSGLEVLTT